MKAAYEKPTLAVISLNVNTVIAASCSNTLYTAVGESCSSRPDPNIGGTDEGAFGSGNECTVQVDDKCYFTATDLVYTS